MNRKLKAALISAVIIMVLSTLLLPLMSAVLAVVMSPIGTMVFVMTVVLCCYGLYRIVLRLLASQQ